VLDDGLEIEPFRGGASSSGQDHDGLNNRPRKIDAAAVPADDRQRAK